MVASKKLADDKDLCKHLLAVVVKFLADEQDAIPIAYQHPTYHITITGAKSLLVSSSVC